MTTARGPIRPQSNLRNCHVWLVRRPAGRPVEVRGADGRFAMSLRQEELFQQSKQDSAFYRNLILPRRTARTAAKDIDLFWVARCQPIKRPHLFLDLVESIPEASCTMVCPRENEALWLSVEKRAATLPNLMFHESIPYHEIQDVYDRAKFVVSTSEAEGFPNNMIQGAQGSAGVISVVVDPDGFIERFGAGFCAAGVLFRMRRQRKLLGKEPNEWRRNG